MEEKKAEGEATQIHLTEGNVTPIVWRDHRRQGFPFRQVNKRMMSHYVLNCTKRLTKPNPLQLATFSIFQSKNQTQRDHLAGQQYLLAQHCEILPLVYKEALSKH